MNQQPIGIIGAMKMEVDAILAAMEGKRQEVHGSMAFTAGTLSGVPCVAVQCSPGKVNAALCTQALVDFFSPRLVLNLGVAGGIGEGLLIKKGQIIRKVPESELLNVLREELLNWKE